MEEQSSLASLLAAKVSRLRPSRTLVTRADGSCYVETRDSSGRFTTMPSDNYAEKLSHQEDSDVTAGSDAHGRKLNNHGHDFTESIPGNPSDGSKSLTHSTTRLLSARCPGFVVDTKPDLRSSLILPHLLLAGQDVAYDVDILAEFGVTHILSLVPPEAVVQESCLVLPDEGHLLKYPLTSNLPEIGAQEARTSPHRETVTQEEMPTADLELLEVSETSQKHDTEVLKTELDFSEGNASSLISTEVNSVENVSSHNSFKEETNSQSPNKMGVSCADNLEQLSTCSDTVRRVYCAMLDTPEFVIRSSLMRCIKFINIVRDGGGVVLVHCNAGVSRAPTVVIAYCMYQMNVTFDEAFDFVKQKRTFIRPNEGFVRQLRSFEVFLRSA